MSLEETVFDLITKSPGKKAKDIALILGVDRRAINSVLYGKLRRKVYQDKSFRWYPLSAAPRAERADAKAQANTLLARLCRYYLGCLSHEDLGDVGEFASSKYGEPDYVELPFLPVIEGQDTDPFESDAARRLLGRIRGEKHRLGLYLGYPLRLKFIRSRKGWEGFRVEPIFLFAFLDGRNKYDRPTLTDVLPQINMEALRSLTNRGEGNVIEEAIQLANELGLNHAATDQPEVDEVFARLQEIRPDWDWRESIDPYNLSVGLPTPDLNQQGIFNRAALFVAERSKYTKGLETELDALQSVADKDFQETILGKWVNVKTIEAPPSGQSPLLEVLPLNSEQRQAVRQALDNPLTVITGPPGTGKSQVVTSILVNAAWHGMTVLFASKNNKAVDVVDTRVNALGPRPILLRLGTNERQGQLAEYLLSLLAATATDDDKARYEEHAVIHGRLREQSEELDRLTEALVNARNRVDLLERQVEQVRTSVGDETFRKFRSIDGNTLSIEANVFQTALSNADRSRQGIGAQLFWPIMRGGRFRNVAAAGDVIRPVSQCIGLPLPVCQVNKESIGEWLECGKRLAERVKQVLDVLKYFDGLTELQQARTLEEIGRDRMKLVEDLNGNSEKLWEAWLRLQPARLSPAQRKLLGDYAAILQLILASNVENRAIGKDVFRRYYQLFPHITSILSCWAITSLSARGRIPFEPGFFDLLVIDEASQCDIASALPLLYRAQRVVIIGDPKQLRHISRLPKARDQQLLSEHGLLDDHAGWAYSTRSLWDLACSLCRSEDIVELRDHHRSHADIIEFSNKAFYEGRLRVATRYDRLRFPKGDEPAIIWRNVKGDSVRPTTGGAVNEVEANSVVSEIERLFVQGYCGTIGVVSPFRAQANRVRELVNRQEKLSSWLKEVEFLSDAVHSFQGDERDVMIFSPGISDSTPRGALWFLRTYPNLFNVAITRARAALIVVGDKNAAINSGVDYLAEFAAYATQVADGARVPSMPNDRDIGPEYPVVSDSSVVSDWEHHLYRALYRAGIRTIPQFKIEKYALDFALFQGDRKLNIEVDGERYHRNWDGELCRRDQIRNQRLIELGWDVKRFWVYRVRDEIEACVQEVQSWLDRR